MRALLDEHLPIQLAGEILDHEVSTVRGEGWSGIANGALLARAAEAGFDVLVTNDSSIAFQQNLAHIGVGIVVLDAPTNKLEDLIPLVPGISDAIGAVTQGEVRHLAG